MSEQIGEGAFAKWSEFLHTLYQASQGDEVLPSLSPARNSGGFQVPRKFLRQLMKVTRGPGYVPVARRRGHVKKVWVRERGIVMRRAAIVPRNPDG